MENGQTEDARILVEGISPVTNELTELDEDYWEPSTQVSTFEGETSEPVLDGASIANQVVAGIILITLGALGAHAYDMAHRDNE
jgi:hypothetical protein